MDGRLFSWEISLYTLASKVQIGFGKMSNWLAARKRGREREIKKECTKMESLLDASTGSLVEPINDGDMDTEWTQ